VTVLAVLLLAAVAFVVVALDPWGQDTAATPRLTPTSTAPTTSATTVDTGFEAMRDFVTDYYALLPANADEAWTRLDPNYQATTNLRDYRNFWSGIRSVAISDVSPSSGTSVTARVAYTLAGGGTDTERRSFEISSDGGQMRIYDSQRIGG
jgi:serine/threonine-protein kinase